MSLFLSRAGQAEILRSAQKDEQYIEQVHQELSEVFSRLNHRLWIKYDELLKIGVKIFYFAFHSVCGLQTIGEEYTGIIQIDSKYSSLPSQLAQVLVVILEFGGELALRNALKHLRKSTSQNPDLTREARQLFLALIDTTLDLIPIFHAFHRGLFYLQGQKYQLSKRLFGINYVLVRYWLKQNHSVTGYKVLGWITLSQALISLVSYVRRKLVSDHKRKSKLRELTEVRSGSSRVCILCMDVRANATSLPCGHIFCWDCVIEWVQQKGSCPVCRDLTQPSQAVFLVNYQRV